MDLQKRVTDRLRFVGLYDSLISGTEVIFEEAYKENKESVKLTVPWGEIVFLTPRLPERCPVCKR
jgi:hypothetical protein